ncbi:hypothetical protein M406DRAFT_320155 [Cryphonectria parasitica EP155]|uniref:Uncharacterized protein n=1 Tax=Cryphonectria parasitica (strain ATCC 38755 / EP155) TaxID=660469 RepID=A0A9P4YAP7_CRYP1|nr:uncharacterized protein M406DRAFT_320155 [Cryphonectria parasitica EP155]KAF3770047.1 hypothetical protein M406DRAFT_320155 [Cryphonectria parasitica EP155]
MTPSHLHDPTTTPRPKPLTQKEKTGLEALAAGARVTAPAASGRIFEIAAPLECVCLHHRIP